MAKRFGGKYSPTDAPRADGTRPARAEVDPAGGRANLLFIPAIPLVFTALDNGATGLAAALVGAAALTGAGFLLRAGLQAEAAYRVRKVARRPAIPRKIFASVLTGIGTAFAVVAHLDQPDLISPLLYGLCAMGLHVAAFGIDPLTSKGMQGVDTFQQDRVARVVDEAEKHLRAMSDAMARVADRPTRAKLDQFQATARDLIRTVEEDPRDLTAARKFLGVYLRGARDATVKFADIHVRTKDEQARQDYLALLDDLIQNFAARTRKSLLEDRGDLNIEIDVLRERLSREGVRLDETDTP